MREAATVLASRGGAVALTGAGISVRSGIPAFRGPKGLWEKFDPMEYATIGAFLSDPVKVWRMLAEMIGIVEEAKPAPAHHGLARLERSGVLRAVVTQNVDGLHQAAGSCRVIEFHGSARELVCLSCDRRYPSRVRLAQCIPPRCDCGAVLKPDLVLFGEPIPPAAREAAEEEARRCRVLLVIGTSAQVSPACEIPLTARRNGAFVVEINPEKTPLTGSVAHLSIRGDAHDVVARLVEQVSPL